MGHILLVCLSAATHMPAILGNRMATKHPAQFLVHPYSLMKAAALRWRGCSVVTELRKRFSKSPHSGSFQTGRSHFLAIPRGCMCQHASLAVNCLCGRQEGLGAVPKMIQAQVHILAFVHMLHC